MNKFNYKKPKIITRRRLNQLQGNKLKVDEENNNSHLGYLTLREGKFIVLSKLLENEEGYPTYQEEIKKEIGHKVTFNTPYKIKEGDVVHYCTRKGKYVTSLTVFLD